MRPATRRRSTQIYILWSQGYAPKEIAAQLNLLSVWVVYKAIARVKDVIEKTGQIGPNSVNTGTELNR